MLLALIAPSAAAAASAGQFLVSGAIDLPAGTSLGGEPLGVYTEEAESVRTISLVAPRAHVYALEQKRHVVAPPGQDRYTVAQPVEVIFERNLTDLRVDLVQWSSGEGWLGIYPGASSTLHLASSAPVGVKVSDFSTLGPAEDPGAPLSGANDQSDQPRQRRYYQSVAEDHLYFEATGAIRATGPMSVKILGPLLHVESREFTGDFRTGRATGTGLLQEETYQWVFFTVEDATFVMESDGLVQMAMGALSASWSGAARFTPVRGELLVDGESYSAKPGAAMVGGDFSGSLAPRRDASRLLTFLAIDGHLSSTTLQPQAANVAAGRGGSDLPWLPLILFGAVVVGGSAGAAVLATRRRRSATPAVAGSPPAFVGPYDGLHADDFIRLADEAAVERRWARALQWAQQARRMAPTNARIRADEGEYLFQLGLFEEALLAFGEASRLDGSEGYADYRGAQAAVAAGRPVDEVLAWLERALGRSPDLVGDLELFKEFDALRGLPAYDAMVRGAYERLGIDPAPA